MVAGGKLVFIKIVVRGRAGERSSHIRGVFDFVVHVGDYAYDLDSNGGVTGDLFQGSIEPITSSTPYSGWCVR